MCWCGPALLDTSKERKCYLNVQVGWFDDSREEDSDLLLVSALVL